VAGKELASFHVITNGKCLLEVERANRSLMLRSGDLVILPHGHAHVLRDHPKTPPTALEDLLAKHTLDDQRTLRHGGRGALTTMLCGGFRFEDREISPLLLALPPVMHIQGARGRSVPWLGLTLKYIVSEVGSQHAGSATVLTRLSDILFIQTARSYFSSAADSESGWLRGLRDAQIGRALALIHSRPAEPWTVASLAAQVAMSRSAFSAKFAALVGEAPLQYVTRRRLQKAAQLLRTTPMKLSTIARQAGYDSDMAFNKAFKRFVGVTPGAYRRAGSRDSARE
jgi:AraC-like DNA-binding protein